MLWIDSRAMSTRGWPPPTRRLEHPISCRCRSCWYGATVLIDALSLEFMGGAEIDYVDDLIGQSFQIKNPNAVMGCGCGTSFSVAI